MVKVQNTTGLSREFLIHPGETIFEVLKDRDMSQKELAIRTGVTEKHISTVVHGQKGISAAFARKLEYALGIEASFWMNLQAHYDRELLEFEDLHQITEQEISVLRNLKEVLNCWSDYNWIDEKADPVFMVLDIRKILCMSNLLDIPKMSYAAVYRAQHEHNTVDPYVLFAWQRMCELLTKDIQTENDVNIDTLRKKIPDIKQVMFMQGNQIQQELTELFAKCGIKFRIVPNFKGAPVQGFIKKPDNGAMILCMTLRQKFADIFWFTLFHEIAHIVNEDTKSQFVDFDSVSGEMEARADRMASEFLMDTTEYQTFIQSGAYRTNNGIQEFAKSQKVQEYIVLGRLMKENRIPWKARDRYDWI